MVTNKKSFYTIVNSLMARVIVSVIAKSAAVDLDYCCTCFLNRRVLA